MSISEPNAKATRDPDLLSSIHALRRAALKARELALQTGTPCYVWQDGRIVNIGTPQADDPHATAASAPKPRS